MKPSVGRKKIVAMLFGLGALSAGLGAASFIVGEFLARQDGYLDGLYAMGGFVLLVWFALLSISVLVSALAFR